MAKKTKADLSREIQCLKDQLNAVTAERNTLADAKKKSNAHIIELAGSVSTLSVKLSEARKMNDALSRKLGRIIAVFDLSVVKQSEIDDLNARLQGDDERADAVKAWSGVVSRDSSDWSIRAVCEVDDTDNFAVAS